MTRFNGSVFKLKQTTMKARIKVIHTKRDIIWMSDYTEYNYINRLLRLEEISSALKDENGFFIMPTNSDNEDYRIIPSAVLRECIIVTETIT